VGPGSGLRAVEMGLRSANTPEALARMEAEARAGGPIPAVSVFGYKDSGKTGVAVELVAELRRRGYRVGAVKHGHGFSLDTPGTDSWRLRHEGDAERVFLAGPEGFGLMGRWGPGGEEGVEELLRAYFAGEGMDVVVVEGYKSGPLPGVEVFRGELHPEPFTAREEPRRGPLLALVSDSAGLACLEERWTDRFLPPPERMALDAPGRTARLADLVERDVIGRTDGGKE
jgi:molybdopterin-guanine dinucleotide biosynthesis protein MobB